MMGAATAQATAYLLHTGSLVGGVGVKDDEGDLRDCGAGQRHMSLRG